MAFDHHPLWSGWALAAVCGLALGCAHGITDRLDDGAQSLSGAGGTCVTTTSTTTNTTTNTTTSTTTTTSTSTTTSTQTSTGCDSSGDCFTCANCSTSFECALEADGCFNDVDCQDLLNCLDACLDQTCADACASAHPTGSALYFSLTRCAFCIACPVDCAVEGQGMCGP